jgi:hypothetical protein
MIRSNSSAAQNKNVFNDLIFLQKNLFGNSSKQEAILDDMSEKCKNKRHIDETRKPLGTLDINTNNIRTQR